MIEFGIRLNLQSRAYTGALTDRTGVPNGNVSQGESFGGAGFASPANEPTKSTSRTVAKEAERQHRRTLEAGYNNFKEVRQNRVRILEEIIDEYLTGYRLRYRSASFAEYALGPVSRLLGTKIVADITDISVLRYQENRLREKASPKSINEEVRFLLKMLGDPGEVIRAHLKKTMQLKPEHRLRPDQYGQQTLQRPRIESTAHFNPTPASRFYHA